MITEGRVRLRGASDSTNQLLRATLERNSRSSRMKIHENLGLVKHVLSNQGIMSR